MRDSSTKGKAEPRPKKPDRPRKPRVRFPNPDQFERPPQDDPIADGDPVKPPKPGKWSRGISEWWKKREKEREHEREKDECGRDRRRVIMPKPYLDATSNFGPQISALGVGEAGTISFTVWNDGNYPAWTCYVEVYEGPGGYTSPLSDYKMRGREIITLHPGERREVQLSWVRQQQTGRVVGIVYDPLLDPRDFAVVEQFNRHITSVHYVNLE